MSTTTEAGVDHSQKKSASTVPLQSLAPAYVEAHHRTYVDRLGAAVKDPRNRNIALTGRYGSGKSSILEEFQAQNAGRTLRLSISSLGPDFGKGAAEAEDGSAGTALTNRIQKEIVKQLIYNAKDRTLRDSSFHRIARLRSSQEFLQNGIAIAALGLLVGLLGKQPEIATLMVNGRELPEWVSWALLGLLAFGALSVVRRALRGRLVSEVQGPGTGVALTEKSPTYFDKYLETIVHFFNEEAYSIVIFEDLDRFEDHHIFEALRELNSLLNSKARRSSAPAKGVRGRISRLLHVGEPEPLRFIYAIRDSVFDRLAVEDRQAREQPGGQAQPFLQVSKETDAVRAELDRANRTKFFDLVIPVVPFISHRSAGELLDSLLEEKGIDGIGRSLVALVARHTTDMRLLVNLCNEYLVYAERLLEGERRAPGLTSEKLFALMAYKTFHLTDFEDIARRASDLDKLYDFRRDLVSTCIRDLEAKRRRESAAATRTRSMSADAVRLGARLNLLADAIASGAGYAPNIGRTFVAGTRTASQEEVGTYEFWQEVAKTNTLTVQLPIGRNLPLTETQLAVMFPGSTKASRWADVDQVQARQNIDQWGRDIAFLRGADFADLAADDRFRLDPASGTASTHDDGGNVCSFGAYVEKTLSSSLARTLVRAGYLDRNFTIYSSHYTGAFDGADVATFMVQAVETNSMELDTEFTGPAAIGNLLEVAGPEFGDSNSIFNIQVVDYLLENAESTRALLDVLVSRLAGIRTPQAETFLIAYFNSGQQRAQLVAELTRNSWREALIFLAGHPDVPDDVRCDLVNSCLASLADGTEYLVDATLTQRLMEHYAEMSVFTEPLEAGQVAGLVKVLESAEFLAGQLARVRDPLKDALVSKRLYELTADNLREAVGVTGPVNLDRLRARGEVYEDCLSNLATYMDVVEQDGETPEAIATEEVLAQALRDLPDEADVTHAVPRLLMAVSREAALTDLREVPAKWYGLLALPRLFAASLSNIETYGAAHAVDKPLLDLLLAAAEIDTLVDGAPAEESTKQAIALSLLNAGDSAGSPADRVALAGRMRTEDPFSVLQVAPVPGELFRMLLAENLIDDAAEAFLHFAPAGWAAVGPAIAESVHVPDFLEPAMVTGMLKDLFLDPVASGKVGARVVGRMAEFIPEQDAAELLATAEFCARTHTAMPMDQLQRVSAVGQPGATEVVFELLDQAKPDADEIVRVLSGLGEPYSRLAAGVGDSFDVPDTDTSRRVLTVLSNAGRCKHRKTRGQRLVTLPTP